MDHFIQYHSPEVMGSGIDEVPSEPYQVYTSHTYANPVGAVVWLIGRKREPEQLAKHKQVLAALTAQAAAAGCPARMM
jgi:hypothetical protein